MVKNWCNVLSMDGVTVCGHHQECRVTKWISPSPSNIVFNYIVVRSTWAYQNI